MNANLTFELPHLPPTSLLLLLKHIISRFSTTTPNIDSQQCKISNFLSSIFLLVFSMIQIRDRKSSTRAYHTKWGNEMMIIFLLAKGFSTSSIFSSPNENIIFNKLCACIAFPISSNPPHLYLFLYISTHIIVYPSPDFAIFHSRSNKIRMKMEFISSRKFIQCSSSIERTSWSQREREKSLQWIDCELFRFKHIQHSHIIYLDRINMIFIFRKVRVEFAESKLPTHSHVHRVSLEYLFIESYCIGLAASFLRSDIKYLNLDVENEEGKIENLLFPCSSFFMLLRKTDTFQMRIQLDSTFMN